MRHLSRSCVVSAAMVAAGIATAHATEGGRPLVGVNYFGGWDEGPHSRWKSPSWRPDRPDWRPLFPDRVPLLGSVTDQATTDREIDAAADHGVDFFSILWYLPGRESKPPSPADTAMHLFLASPQAHRLRFMIEYCNHAGLSAATDEEWAACVAAWTEAMKHPSALRVGGRLVFKIHSTGEFLAANGGDVERCKKQLAALRNAVADAGLGEMIIGGGTMSRSGIGPKHPAVQLFDFTATYMTVPKTQAEVTAEAADADLPFSQLAAEARFGRQFHAKDPVPWMPYLAVGWNPRPWTHKRAAQQHRTFFAFPSREQWTAELESMKDDFERYPSLGLPLPNGGTQKAFTIYAWNEFGEGGFLAPTAADKAMKLEAIRDVFGGPATAPVRPAGRAGPSAAQHRAHAGR